MEMHPVTNSSVSLTLAVLFLLEGLSFLVWRWQKPWWDLLMSSGHEVLWQEK
jgi:hypothetical protein